MKKDDLKRLYEVNYILSKNCKFCGNKFPLKNSRMRFCTSECRTNYHSFLRKFPHIKPLADHEIPISMEWIIQTAEKLNNFFVTSKDLTGFLTDSCCSSNNYCICLEDIKKEIDLDILELLCNSCCIKRLNLILYYPNKTRPLVQDFEYINPFNPDRTSLNKPD